MYQMQVGSEYGDEVLGSLGVSILAAHCFASFFKSNTMFFID